MITRNKPYSLLLVLMTLFLSFEGRSESEVTPGSIILDQLESIDSIEPESWGIYNGCVALHKIRAINFLDDQVAIIDLRRRRQAVLMLRRECRGIAQQGFTFDTRSGQLCERFSRLTQTRSGISCEIESIEPHVRLPDGASNSR